jgi:hypothetical protein
VQEENEAWQYDYMRRKECFSNSKSLLKEVLMMRCNEARGLGDGGGRKCKSSGVEDQVKGFYPWRLLLATFLKNGGQRT